MRWLYIEKQCCEAVSSSVALAKRVRLTKSAMRPLKRSTKIIGLRVLGRAEPVLDAERSAGAVEDVAPRRRSGLAGEAVGELAGVVGEDALDAHQRGLPEPAQEVAAAGLALVDVGAQVHPSAWPGRWPRTGSACCSGRAFAAGT